MANKDCNNCGRPLGEHTIHELAECAGQTSDNQED